MSGPNYDPNIPQPNDNLAQSQVDFLSDFSILYNTFMANHVPLDAMSEAGNHTFVQLLQQPNAPQTNTSEISVYTSNVAGQTDQIFLKYQNGTIIQVSNYQIYSIDADNGQTSYFTFLPGKILMYFGTFNAPASPGGNTLYFRPLVAKNIISVNLCPMGTTAGYPPWFTLQQDFPNVYTAIRVFPPSGIIALGTYFYVALANI